MGTPSANVFDGLSDDQLQALKDYHDAGAETGKGVTQGGDYFSDPQTPEYQATHGPLAGKSDLAKFGYGLASAPYEIGIHAGNLLGLIPDDQLNQAEASLGPIKADQNANFGNMVGQTAQFAPLGFSVGALSSKVLPWLAGRTIIGGAAEGAGQNYLMGAPGEKGKDAILGAATGAALPIAGSVGSTAINGATRTPAAQYLVDQGVSLPPWLMNPKGNSNIVAQSIDHLPVAKPMIEGATESAKQDWQRATIQMGAAPGTKITPSENINDMYAEAAKSWNPVYAQTKGFPIKPVTSQGVPLTQALANASQVPGLQPSEQQALNAWLQARLQRVSPQSLSEEFTGADSIRSAIRARQRQLLQAQRNSVQAPLMMEGLDRAEDAINDALYSQLPKDVSQTLQAADAGYSKLKVVERAVVNSGDRVGGLTPASLSQAIKQSEDAGRYAQGSGGDLRDMAQAGTRVFQTVVPVNGARAASAGALAGAAYFVPHAMPVVGAAAGAYGLGSLALGATGLGRRLASGQTAAQRYLQRIGVNVPPQIQSAARSGFNAYTRPGDAGSMADQFLQHLDAVEQERRDAQTGNSSGNSKGSPAVVTASSVVGAGP